LTAIILYKIRLKRRLKIFTA